MDWLIHFQNWWSIYWWSTKVLCILFQVHTRKICNILAKYHCPLCIPCRVWTLDFNMIRFTGQKNRGKIFRSDFLLESLKIILMPFTSLTRFPSRKVEIPLALSKYFNFSDNIPVGGATGYHLTRLKSFLKKYNIFILCNENLRDINMHSVLTQ